MTISRSDAEGGKVVGIVAAVILNDSGNTLMVRKRDTVAFMHAGEPHLHLAPLTGRHALPLASDLKLQASLT
jgi:hypothetical protein